MAKETWQEVEDSIAQQSVNVQPTRGLKLFVSNLIRRTWAAVWGWYDGRPQRVFTDGSNRLEVAPHGEGWSFKSATTGLVTLANGSYTNVLTNLDNTWKRITLIAAGGVAIYYEFTIDGTTYVMAPHHNTIAFTVEGRISLVRGQGVGSTVTCTAWCLEYED